MPRRGAYLRGCHAVSSVHARRPEGNSWFARVPFSNLCRIVHEARMIIYSGPCGTILHLCLEAQTGTPRSDGSTNCLHLCLEMLNGSTNCLRGSPFVPEQRAFYNLLSGLTVSSSQTSVPIFLVLQMPRLPARVLESRTCPPHYLREEVDSGGQNTGFACCGFLGAN